MGCFADLLRKSSLCGILLLVATMGAYAQTEQWPQYSRWLDYSRFYSEDRPTTSGLALISGGEYWIGADAESLTKYMNAVGETNIVVEDFTRLYPRRKVKLEAFYILTREVSNKEYSEFLDTEYRPPPFIWSNMEGFWPVMEIFSWRGMTFPPGRAGFPVTGISYEDAEDFCEWRTRQTEVLHRLPTEEEWEAAYRGKEGRVFPWGNRWTGPVSVAIGRNMAVGPDPFFAHTDDITPEGVKFLFGNVHEFVSTPEESSSVYDVTKGGAYDLSPDSRKAFPAHRSRWVKGARGGHNTGFRYVIPSASVHERRGE